MLLFRHHSLFQRDNWSVPEILNLLSTVIKIPIYSWRVQTKLGAKGRYMLYICFRQPLKLRIGLRGSNLFRSLKCLFCVLLKTIKLSLLKNKERILTLWCLFNISNYLSIIFAYCWNTLCSCYSFKDSIHSLLVVVVLI